MLNIQHVRALGEILNDTFGKSNSKSSHVSMGGSLQGDTLSLKFSTIVHFAGERNLRDQVEVISDESIQRLSNRVSEIKKQFKEITGEGLKLEEVSNRDNIELISATSNSPRKIAYYRRFADLKLSV